MEMADYSKVLIVAHGETPTLALAHRMAASHTCILATDGAVNVCMELGITPDVISGDMDSVDLKHVRESYPQIEVVETLDQEMADLEKAILVAVDRGAAIVTVIGATGKRPDHTLGNLALLQQFAGAVDIRFEDRYGSTRCLVGGRPQSVVSVLTEPGDTISIIGCCHRTVVSASGVKWPLKMEELTPGTRGVSNIALANEVRLEVHSGAAFVCHLHASEIEKQSR